MRAGWSGVLCFLAFVVADSPMSSTTLPQFKVLSVLILSSINVVVVVVVADDDDGADFLAARAVVVVVVTAAAAPVWAIAYLQLSDTIMLFCSLHALNALFSTCQDDMASASVDTLPLKTNVDLNYVSPAICSVLARYTCVVLFVHV